MDPSPRVITHHSCITIKRAAGDVAAYVLDPATMPHWSAVVHQVDDADDDVFRAGGRLRGSMHILGVTLPIEGEMVEWDPEGLRAAILVRPVDADGMLEHELSVEELGDASVLHFRNRLTLPAWVPPEVVSEELVRHLLDQTSSFALANIRYILEHAEEARIRSFIRLMRGEP